MLIFSDNFVNILLKFSQKFHKICSKHFEKFGKFFKFLCKFNIKFSKIFFLRPWVIFCWMWSPWNQNFGDASDYYCGFLLKNNLNTIVFKWFILTGPNGPKNKFITTGRAGPGRRNLPTGRAGPKEIVKVPSLVSA